MGGASYAPIALRAVNLGCDRGGMPVFRGVNFTLEPGAALVVRGDNGAGKSSLLRLIAGLTPIAEGQLQIRFGDGQWENANAMGHVAWQGHDDAHKRALSVRDNLKFWAEAGDHKAAVKTAIEGAIEAAIAQVGLGRLAGMQAGQLSAGQRRRLALARLLVQKQCVWLLDEPTAALDASAAQLSEALTSAHIKAGGIAIIATHSAFAPKGAVSALNLVAV